MKTTMKKLVISLAIALTMILTVSSVEAFADDAAPAAEDVIKTVSTKANFFAQINDEGSINESNERMFDLDGDVVSRSTKYFTPSLGKLEIPESFMNKYNTEKKAGKNGVSITEQEAVFWGIGDNNKINTAAKKDLVEGQIYFAPYVLKKENDGYHIDGYYVTKKGEEIVVIETPVDPEPKEEPKEDPQPNNDPVDPEPKDEPKDEPQPQPGNDPVDPEPKDEPQPQPGNTPVDPEPKDEPQPQPSNDPVDPEPKTVPSDLPYIPPYEEPAEPVVTNTAPETDPEAPAEEPAEDPAPQAEDEFVLDPTEIPAGGVEEIDVVIPENPAGGVEEFEVEEPEIPAGDVLPQTGKAQFPLFCAFGGIFAALGIAAIIFRKKLF